MLIKLEHINQFHTRAFNENGNCVEMDSGENQKGMSPMELLIAAIGGCSTIDVIHILQKQKINPPNISVEMLAEKESVGTYSEFKKIHLIFSVSDDVEIEKISKAIEMSLEKYCSVAKTLEKTAEITWNLMIKD